MSAQALASLDRAPNGLVTRNCCDTVVALSGTGCRQPALALTPPSMAAARVGAGNVNRNGKRVMLSRYVVLVAPVSTTMAKALTPSAKDASWLAPLATGTPSMVMSPDAAVGAIRAVAWAVRALAA